MAQRYQPGDIITADIVNNILARLENLEARLTALEDRKDNAKETKEKEKDGAKETKEKDTKETKEKDTKETKEKDTKETKDTKDTKEKDTKETKDTKDTKEKDTKETKEKDTKETKEKDTKELSKDNKESKETKENKENKEEKEEKEIKEDKDSSKEFLSLKEKETSPREHIPAPYDPNPAPAHFLLDAEGEEPDGRAFILPEERPEVGRAALDLADKQGDKLPESNTAGKQAEAFN